jgi:SEC-C motif domain protein
MSCPCCSEKPFSECCEPFISGEQLPQTPEELMRSRYTAYTLIDVEYLIKTTHPKMRKYYSAKSIKAWAQNCKWLKLEVLSASGVNVHFKAYYEEDGELDVHEEFSTFKQEKGIWYFVEGASAPPA